MAEQDGPWAHALCLGRSYEVLAQHFEQGRSRHAGNDCQWDGAESDRRQYEVTYCVDEQVTVQGEDAVERIHVADEVQDRLRWTLEVRKAPRLVDWDWLRTGGEPAGRGQGNECALCSNAGRQQLYW